MSQETIIEYGVKLMIIFLITPVHEFAHAWAATKCGDDTPRLQGRLTLNPFAHLDILGAISMFCIGFGWGKPVQVNPVRFKKMRRDTALVAAAGPISNLIFGLLGIIVYKFLYYDFYYVNPTQAIYWVMFIFYYFTAINFNLAVFNLIPIPPLDGSKILSYFASNKWNKLMYEYGQYISIVFTILVISRVLNTPLSWLSSLVFNAMDKLTFFIDIIAKAVFGIN